VRSAGEVEESGGDEGGLGMCQGEQPMQEVLVHDLLSGT